MSRSKREKEHVLVRRVVSKRSYHGVLSPPRNASFLRLLFMFFALSLSLSLPGRAATRSHPALELSSVPQSEERSIRKRPKHPTLAIHERRLHPQLGVREASSEIVHARQLVVSEADADVDTVTSGDVPRLYARRDVHAGRLSDVNRVVTLDTALLQRLGIVFQLHAVHEDSDVVRVRNVLKHLNGEVSDLLHYALWHDPRKVTPPVQGNEGVALSALLVVVCNGRRERRVIDALSQLRKTAAELNSLSACGRMPFRSGSDAVRIREIERVWRIVPPHAHTADRKQHVLLRPDHHIFP